MYPRTSEHKIEIQVDYYRYNFCCFAKKNIPMGCSDFVLPGPLLRNHSVNCLLSNKNKEPYKDHLCVFRALAMYMNGHKDFDSHTSRYFTQIVSKSGHDSKNFRGVSVEDLPVVEEIVQIIVFIYDSDIQEGEYVGGLARRSIGKLNKTAELLRINNHIIHTNDINSFIKCFRCPSCSTNQTISISISGEVRIE